MNIKAFVLSFCLFCSNADAYKILGVFPSTGKSHFFVGTALMEGLAEAGHNITVVAPFQVKNSYKNYKQVVLDPTSFDITKEIQKNDGIKLNNFYFWDIINQWCDLMINSTKKSLSDVNFLNFLKIQQDFDVIIIEPTMRDAFYGISQHFEAPAILLSAMGPAKWITDLDGTPSFASYIPHIFHPYSDQMTFWQRMHNSFIFWYEDIVKIVYFNRIQEKLMHQGFPNTKNWPSIDVIKRNVSLILLNSHVTYSTARPYGPNVIEVGGMHIKKIPDPLTPNIQTFLDTAHDGVIYISFGSILSFNKISKYQKDAILNAFSSFPNVRILLKSDEKVVIPSHNDSNVLVESWFPQQSILKHRNVKIFVTHGGMHSTSEAAIFGKPIIGVPCFADQNSNMQIAESKGHGISIPIKKVNSQNFKAAVDAVMNDPRYAIQAKLTSERYWELQGSALEKAIHYVEHVAKNKGAPHLKSIAIDLPFYVLYNLDVWISLTSFTILIVMIFYSVNRRIFSIIYNVQMKKKIA